MLRLLKYLRKREWLYVACAVTFIVAQVWLDLKMPEYMNSVTQIAQGRSTAHAGAAGGLSDIWVDGGFMLLCAIGSLICSIISSYFIVHIGVDFSTRIREAVYTKVQGFSLGEINRFSTASLITRSTNDVQQIQNLMTVGLQMMIKAPITAVWAIAKISASRQEWTIAMGIAVVALVTVVISIVRLVTPKFKLLQSHTDHLNQLVRENLSGIRVIRAYNAEDFQQGKFEEVNEEFTGTSLFTNRATAFINPFMSLVMNGMSLAIYWTGAYVINTASLEEYASLFGNMVVFMSYGLQIITAFILLSALFMNVPRSLVSAQRINEVLDAQVSVEDGPGVGKTDEVGTVVFDHVCFSYPDGRGNAISDVSFAARKGDTVAFIGATGSGKTTVVNLVPRFYDVTAGRVLVDGHDVREYRKSELAKRIGYVSQRSVLFSGDIRSNVDFGDNESDDATVKRAIAIAQGSDFVDAQEKGIEAAVAQMGTNLSGGQRQRLSIARAVARHPEIYIFDDSFSALDYKTDRALRQALKDEMADATCLIVAHRIGTIMNADLIVVLEDGRVAGQGTHEELMASCEAYQELAYSQLSEEELR
ncbi:MAG: ABC transporter ATP-binding protein [Coriobacteriales bacterium]|nr:ABC transporter ATP-binding protein [Coriobacteriales bacterium]